MIKENLKFLVVEGYGKSTRDELAVGGMSLASDLYRQMLLSLAPNAIVDIVTPADADARVPSGVELKSYDGAAMTGSNAPPYIVSMQPFLLCCIRGGTELTT